MLAMLGALDNDTTTTDIKVLELGVSVGTILYHAGWADRSCKVVLGRCRKMKYVAKFWQRGFKLHSTNLSSRCQSYPFPAITRKSSPLQTHVTLKHS
jgi:hypothetical protein